MWIFSKNWKISVHILPELKLGRMFPGVYFVNTNLPDERVLVLLPKKELIKVSDNSLNIFERSNIGHYIERISATFCMDNTVF